MKISIHTIPHAKQRYDTVGDYYVKGGTLHVLISEMQDWRYEFLAALHELAEFFFTKNDGVTEREITIFDINYEKDRSRGKYTSDQEPGNDPDAPYRKQHFVADIIERTAAMALGIDWGKYSAAVSRL